MSRSLFPPEHETVEKQHGRLETRRIWTSSQLSNYVDFPYSAQVARIQRIAQVMSSGKTRTEVVYLITSLSPQKACAKCLLALNRGHWEIENCLHWVRDVTFAEDPQLLELSPEAAEPANSTAPFPQVPGTRQRPESSKFDRS